MNPVLSITCGCLLALCATGAHTEELLQGSTEASTSQPTSSETESAADTTVEAASTESIEPTDSDTTTAAATDPSSLATVKAVARLLRKINQPEKRRSRRTSGRTR